MAGTCDQLTIIGLPSTVVSSERPPMAVPMSAAAVIPPEGAGNPHRSCSVSPPPRCKVILLGAGGASGV